MTVPIILFAVLASEATATACPAVNPKFACVVNVLSPVPIVVAVVEVPL